MSTLGDLKERFYKFRQQKYALYVGLALTFLICSILLIYTASLCFGLLLVALVGYYIPYFFGMKSKKKLAVWGLVLLILLSVPYLALIVDGQKASENNPLSTADGVLQGGTVTPFYGTAGTNHTFSIVAQEPNNFTEVNVIIIDVWTSTTVYNRSMDAAPAAGGTLYTFHADPALGTGLTNQTEYGYWFIAYDGSKWVATQDSNYGPMHVSDLDLYIHWWPLLMLALVIQIGLLYYLLLGLSVMTDRSKARVEEAKRAGERGGKLPPAKGGVEEKFVCSECGADVPSSADKCPQCGERFDEDKDQPKTAPVADKGKDEFFCTECGAKVNEDSKTCWNCGKDFEN